MRKIFRVSPHQRLIIVEDAIKQMQSFAQRRWWHAEAGGVLLGRHLLETDDIVVDLVTTPQKTDRRSRFGFFRSKMHEEIARERWEQQSNTLAYLGSWHTHPEKDPNPSGTDLQDWQNAIKKDAFEGQRLFFPIVGTNYIRVWSLSRDGSIIKLTEEANPNG
ncbi:MAG TPA: Mov34/MPN/PAD-1 family protein [Methylophilus sp.]|nr:Mov34/MPN/PAD-1 family protein [Methylophilus sp.]HQQ32392.1 Mov34/MPN/PAD-1 family protein [Methylophilus sp.]